MVSARSSIVQNSVKNQWIGFKSWLAMRRRPGPLKAEPAKHSADKTFRILALDGGGIRALITLTLLERLEEAVPGLLKSVDLISGTSAGGILAMAMADGLDPAQLSELFLQRAGELFEPNGFKRLSMFRGMLSPAYRNEGLRRAAVQMFGQKRLCDLPRQVVVPSFSLDGHVMKDGGRCWSPVYFHNLDDSAGSRAQIAEVALCTSAAPGFFPVFNGHVDGGLTAANPSLVALTLTQDSHVRMSNRPGLASIALLSLGTGHFYQHLDTRTANWGIIQWYRHLLTMMVQGGIRQANELCGHLVGRRYHRLDPMLPHAIRADALDFRQELVEIAHQVDIGPTIAWLETTFMASGGRQLDEGPADVVARPARQPVMSNSGPWPD